MQARTMRGYGQRKDAELLDEMESSANPIVSFAHGAVPITPNGFRILQLSW